MVVESVVEKSIKTLEIDGLEELLKKKSLIPNIEMDGNINMYGIKRELTKDNILKVITEEEIFRHYFGHEFKLGICYVSDLRADDDTPSLNFYWNKDGRLRYKDFGGSQGSCFDYVKEKHKCSFIEALKIINTDLNLGLEGFKESKPVRYERFVTKFQKEFSHFQFEPQAFRESDLKYWQSYGISKDTLKRYNVFSTAKLWHNGQLRWVYSEDNPIFTYWFKGEDKIKCYRPLAQKKKKWLTNAGGILQGIEQLPEKGNLLIVTSSLKDCMLFSEFGIPAIAPGGEGHFLSAKQVDFLWACFDNIVVAYDNDLPGVNASIKLTKEIGAGYWNIPKKYKEKDITDFYREHGKEATKELIKIFL